ncbi:UNVERIFIED_CONTAM: hypothetical protein PYX00_009017 [Menopon gallinae]|uniref:Cytosol aminopeptidase domain-containing protein n=1 Tax=Menopon gallinae TaxID=328185 RepID=A0AAW2H9Z1_9NEOP
MTPILFAQKSVEILCKAGVNVQVKVRNWAELQGMGGFLAVSKGSCQEPIFMEISFHGTNNIKERPIVLIGGVRTGLSTAASAVFTNSDRLWNTMQLASVHTGDRVWRFPLFNHYSKKMVTSSSFDLKNKGREGPGGDPCRAAAFLGEFVPCGEWLHMDNYGVTVSDGISDPPYLRPGMTGRPTRTLIEFLSQLVCKHES